MGQYLHILCILFCYKECGFFKIVINSITLLNIFFLNSFQLVDSLYINLLSIHIESINK